MLVINCNNWKH